MPSTVPDATLTQAARLEQRIKKHKVEVARLRKQLNDPAEALSAFVVNRFELQALVPDDHPVRSVDGTTWEEDDDLDAW